MPNGFEAFASNAIALGNTWRERRKERKLADALVKFDDDPDAAIAGVTRADPIVGWNMRTQVQNQATAAAEAKRARTTDALKTVTGLLGPVAMDPNATPESLATAYDSIMPILSDGLGMSPEEIVKWKDMFVKNPAILKDIEDKANVVAPGSAVVRGGREIYRNPYPDSVLQVVRGDGGRDVIQVPRSYGGTPMTAPATGAMPPSFEQLSGGGGVSSTTAIAAALMPALVQQETGGRPGIKGPPTKYGRAVGLAQTLPVTAQAMAQKLGLPWRPDLLEATTEEGAQYQFALGQAYLQEGLEKYGGDPAKALMYYHGGPDERLWGPKTRRYARETLARLQGGGQGGGYRGFGGVPETGPVTRPAGGAAPFYTTPGKPAAGPGATGSVLTRQEVDELGLSQSVRWQRTKNGEIKPIGGANLLNKVQKQDQIYESITANTKRMEDSARKLLTHPGLERSAGAMSYVPSVRGGRAADFEKNLEALKSKIGFTILNDMRQMSPTGGALGNVSNFEVETLQRNIAALDVSQSPAQLRANIKEIVDYAAQLRQRYQRAYKLDRSKTGYNDEAQRGGTTAPPRGAVDMLRSNPSPQRRQQFDAIFGPGAAKRVLGGK